jgi:hypothetical protein
MARTPPAAIAASNRIPLPLSSTVQNNNAVHILDRRGNVEIDVRL